MKKTLIILFLIIILGALGYFIYINYFEEKIKKIETEEEIANINEYYIYGNHFNLSGEISLNQELLNYASDIKLVLYNGEDKEIDLITSEENNTLSFKISEEINEGLYLDDIAKGKYNLFLRISLIEKEKEEEKTIYKYYKLNNNTNYPETIYYTLSKYNNQIIINSDNDYPTLMFKVIENKDKENIADITIDPGHGGMDGGGSNKNYNEKDLTLQLSTKLAKELEKLGLKVKMTHKEGQLTTNDLLDEYNKGGRAVIPNEVKSKYTFSIHINKNNSSKVNGLEVYTPANINYDFAKNLANNITSYTGINYSSNKLHKMYNGVYTHNFTNNEIASSLESYKEKNYNPYNVTVNSNYLYMIRETGGFMTGAYIDNSNEEKVGVNPYYNSNIGNESYLLELGYLSNNSDLEIILSNEDKFVSAIVDSIKAELGI